MANNWRILDLTYLSGAISFDKTKRKLIVFSEKTGEVSEHSLPDINILFIGLGVTIKRGTIFHLVKNDVVTVYCDWKGLPVSSIYPWIDAHGRVAARQRAQAALSAPRSKNAWMRIIKAKIMGQANVLEALDISGSQQLKELAKSVKSGDPDNREGLAARLYWHRLFSDTTFTRKPGSKHDYRNSLLDYSYTILRGHSMRAVLAAGLTPALGLYHKERSNAFALADDIIEPFRPAVDFNVVKISQETNSTEMDRDTRRMLLEACIGVFGSSQKTIPTTMKEFAQHYGQYVEGELSFLNVPTVCFNSKYNNENRS